MQRRSTVLALPDSIRWKGESSEVVTDPDTGESWVRREAAAEPLTDEQKARATALAEELTAFAAREVDRVKRIDDPLRRIVAADTAAQQAAVVCEDMWALRDDTIRELFSDASQRNDQLGALTREIADALFMTTSRVRQVRSAVGTADKERSGKSRFGEVDELLTPAFLARRFVVEAASVVDIADEVGVQVGTVERHIDAKLGDTVADTRPLAVDDEGRPAFTNDGRRERVGSLVTQAGMFAVYVDDPLERLGVRSRIASELTDAT